MLDPDLYNSSGALRALKGRVSLGTPHRHQICMHAVLAHRLRDFAVLDALAPGVKLVCPGSSRHGNMAWLGTREAALVDTVSGMYPTCCALHYRGHPIHNEGALPVYNPYNGYLTVWFVKINQCEDTERMPYGMINITELKPL